MFARSAIVATAVVLVGFASSALAVFSQGNINYTRDYVIRYNKNYYDTTETFCKAFRAECVNYVGALNYHHQLDCVFAQTGPSIHAFCGGIQKNANGDYADGEEPIVPFTAAMITQVKGAKILSEPVGEIACRRAARRHPTIVC